jgi:L-fuculose-phosphate aldolase
MVPGGVLKAACPAVVTVGHLLTIRPVFLSDVRLTFRLMYRPEPAELSAGREQLVSYSNRLLDDGLAVGSAGNLSARFGDTVLITPSGVPYRGMAPGQVIEIGLAGPEPSVPAGASSETPMHLAIYAATGAGGVVHTHSPEIIALSAVRDDLPAIHYAIHALGGTVRVAPYTRFGSAGLAAAALTALDSRRAAILANHGAICYGRTLAEAYEHALLLEWLARTYRLARAHGEPKILTDDQLAEVAAEAKRRRYGEAPAAGPPTAEPGG